jgi:hypothetical protein
VNTSSRVPVPEATQGHSYADLLRRSSDRRAPGLARAAQSQDRGRGKHPPLVGLHRCSLAGHGLHCWLYCLRPPTKPPSSTHRATYIRACSSEERLKRRSGCRCSWLFKERTYVCGALKPLSLMPRCPQAEGRQPIASGGTHMNKNSSTPEIGPSVKPLTCDLQPAPASCAPTNLL